MHKAKLIIINFSLLLMASPLLGGGCHQRGEAATSYRSHGIMESSVKKFFSDGICGACFKNYDRIKQNTEFLITLPKDGEIYGVQFVPVQGELRNQRIEVAIVNETSDYDEKKVISVYRRVLCRTEVEWEYVDTIKLAPYVQQVDVSLKPDGTAVVFDEVLMLGQRFLS